MLIKKQEIAQTKSSKAKNLRRILEVVKIHL